MFELRAVMLAATLILVPISARAADLVLSWHVEPVFTLGQALDFGFLPD